MNVRTCIFILVALAPAVAFAQQNIGNPYNQGYQQPGGIYYGGMQQPGIVGDPYNKGYQQSIIGGPGIIGQQGTIPDQQNVPEFEPKELIPKKIDQHLIIKEGGVGDQCKAGVTPPTEWRLNFIDPLLTKDDLLHVIQTAAANDTRLRAVNILDDQIDMYYLQPAYKWGVIPTNYYLHVSVNATSLKISLDKPKWLGSATNYHSAATNAFTTYVPMYLTETYAASIKANDMIMRDAMMLELVSAIMYNVQVSPISNSFFVCYILPFLLYIILAVVIGAVALWFIIKKIRKDAGLLVKRIHPIDPYHDDFEQERMGDQYVTHIKPPKQ